ncbi:hypothetical protein R0J90_01380 [Micrococcus sp. SIMBA_144]
MVHPRRRAPGHAAPRVGDDVRRVRVGPRIRSPSRRAAGPCRAGPGRVARSAVGAAVVIQASPRPRRRIAPCP